MNIRTGFLRRRAAGLGIAIMLLLGMALPAAADKNSVVPAPPSDPFLTRAEITGPAQVLAGTTPTYTAQAVYSDESRRDANFAWTVSAGTVDRGNWKVPDEAGDYTITATWGAVSATQVVTVVRMPTPPKTDDPNPPAPGDEVDELNPPPDMLGHWALEPVMQLLRLGLIELTERGTFDPDVPAVRYDVARLVALAAGLDLERADLSLLDQFQDGPLVPEYHRRTVAAIVASRLMVGTECCFDGWGLLNRAQMAVIVDRMLPDVEPIPLIYADRDIIPAWAMSSVRQATATGVMRGFIDGTLRPNDQMTRAEMAAIIARVLDVQAMTR